MLSNWDFFVFYRKNLKTQNILSSFFEIHSPRFFGIQCPKDFCDFGLLSRLAQAEGGGGLLYDISLPKTYRPKLLRWLTNFLGSTAP